MASQADRAGHAAALVRPPGRDPAAADYTRLRTDLTRERTRHYSRLEELLEDALIKVSAVASKLDTKSVRDMLEALIGGERDPQVLAGVARGRMRSKHDRLVQALTGKFDDHHAELARMLLDQIDALSAQTAQLTTRIEELIAAIPAAQGVDPDGSTGPAAGLGHGAPVLPAADRLDEVTGIGREAAQTIIAEIGLHMGVFPTPRPPGVLGQDQPADHPVRRPQPRRAHRQGQPLPQGSPRRGRRRGRQDRHLPRRTLRRLARRRGKLKALVAIARSILVIVWHLLAEPRHPLPRPRRRLLHHPDRQRPQDPQPHPPAPSSRVHRHPRARRLTSAKTEPGSATPPGAAARPAGNGYFPVR